MPREFKVSLRDGREATIREMQLADAEGYLSAIREVISEPQRTLVVQESEIWSPEEFARNLQPWSAEGVRLVADLAGEIVGAINLRRTSKVLAERHIGTFGIFLTQNGRGLGLGQALLEVAEEWARDVGVSRLQICVFAHNERAQNLYRSMGYEVEGYVKSAMRFPEGDVDEYRLAKLL
jgi:L-phenylalanine/L-methionine N-acetyltransferase